MRKRYGRGGKSSTGERGAFEEDFDGNQDAVFLADEVSSMDVVPADAGRAVLEDEVAAFGYSPTMRSSNCSSLFMPSTRMVVRPTSVFPMM
jgi:hypothetical protein